MTEQPRAARRPLPAELAERLRLQRARIDELRGRL
jgi:hypothetical protein